MSREDQRGKVQTVLGTIEPEALGQTLTHEHVLIDLTCYFEAPQEASARSYIDAPFTMDRLGNSRVHWRYYRDNLTLLDEAEAVREVSAFRLAGGDCLVDATSIGIGRDPLALARISRSTGLNIVMGASHYTPFSHPPDMDERSEQAIADEIVRDVTVGVGETGIRAGIIGEVGCWWPMTDNVAKILRASVSAQTETGATILIHPGFHDEAHDEIMDILVKAGADPVRVIMGHLDITRNDMGALRALAETGCFMEYDTFGSEDTSHPPLSHLDGVSDVQRMERIELLIEHGHLDQIVVAQDVCTKRHTTRYGGKGFAHILENIVPRMKRRGFTDEQVRAILVDNPRRALTFR